MTRSAAPHSGGSLRALRCTFALSGASGAPREATYIPARTHEEQHAGRPARACRPRAEGHTRSPILINQILIKIQWIYRYTSTAQATCTLG